MPLKVKNHPESPTVFTHRQASAASDLLRHKNRDSVLEIGPRSSVDHAELQNPSEKRGISKRGGHVVDMAVAATGSDRHQLTDLDDTLGMVISAWQSLPKPIIDGIAVMVSAYLKNK
jgi:hypothetical protein